MSLLFDLDQGMAIGLPGLFAALVAAPFLVSAPNRKRWLVASLMLGSVALPMAIPTLSAINWNSGCVVFTRYAYWLAMPLLAIVLMALPAMPRSAGICMAAVALMLQCPNFFEYRLLGDNSKPLEHAPQARWMLEHFPARYNPDAEIFFERSVGGEDAMPFGLVYLYWQNGIAVKLLRQSTNADATANICPPGQRMQGEDVRVVDSG
jgi:hypothetical protein